MLVATEAPLAIHLEIRHAGHPLLVYPFDLHRKRVALDACQESPQARTSSREPGRTCAHPVFAHESLDATSTDALSTLLERRMDAWAAIGLVAS